MAFPSLAEIHETSGASMAFPEASLPLSYGDPAAEAGCARETVGVFDRSDLAKALLHGPDSAMYAHRRLSNSVSTLASGQGCEAALLGGDGRMIFTLAVHRLGAEALLLLAEAPFAASLVKQMDKYIITEEATVEDQRTRFGVIHFLGPKALEAAAGALGASIRSLEPWAIAPIPPGPSPSGYLCRHDLGRIPGTLLLIEAKGLAAAWGRAIESAAGIGGGPAGSAAWEILRVEEGEPRYGAEWDEGTIPLEVSLTRLMDYKKGCYPGQEVIARITNLGHPARALVGLKRFAAVRAPGPLLKGGREVGRITSSALSPTHGPIGLGLVRWDFRQKGIVLETENGTQVETVGLPFPSP